MTGRVGYNLIEVRQGDSFAINLQIKQNNHPVDLTGASLLMQVRDQQTNALVFSINGTEVDIKNGKMALLFTPKETSADTGDYNTDIQLTTSDGSVNTIFPANVNQIATFRITKQVTTGA